MTSSKTNDGKKNRKSTYFEDCRVDSLFNVAEAKLMSILLSEESAINYVLVYSSRKILVFEVSS